MSQYHAITWTVKPGSEATVEDLFRKSGRPNHDIRGADGSIIGRLLHTMVFMKENRVVRVIEFEGCELPAVTNHMRQQEELIKLEQALEPYLETPRDVSTPEGGAKYFRDVSMRFIMARHHNE